MQNMFDELPPRHPSRAGRPKVIVEPEREVSRCPTCQAPEGDPLIQSFARTLREQPGTWGIYPNPLSYASARSFDNSIRRGVRRYFPPYEFEAAVRNRVLFVRYIGEVQTSDDAKHAIDRMNGASKILDGAVQWVPGEPLRTTLPLPGSRPDPMPVPVRKTFVPPPAPSHTQRPRPRPASDATLSRQLKTDGYTGDPWPEQ